MENCTWTGLLAAAVVVCGGMAAEADAGTGRVRRVAVRPTAGSPDGAAAGVVKVKRSGTRQVTRVRLRGLAPGLAYDVLAARSGNALATVVADDEGRARVRIVRVEPDTAHARPREQGGGRPGPDAVVVLRAHTGQVALFGDRARAVQVDPGAARHATLGFGREDGVRGSVLLGEDGRSACVTVTLDVPDESGDASYVLAVSRHGAFGALPAEAATLSELVGRALQIRDGTGALVVGRYVPELRDGAPTPEDAALDGAELTAGAGPFEVWIADAEGVLARVGEMRPAASPDPTPGGGWESDHLYAGLFYGAYFGDHVGLSLSSRPGGDVFTVEVFVSDGSLLGGTSHALAVTSDGQGGGLPLGIASVTELAGRRFEVRNDAGLAIVSDVFPVLVGGGPWGTGGGVWGADGDPMLPPGDGPFSLWIEDAAGDLTHVAALHATGTGEL